MNTNSASQAYKPIEDPTLLNTLNDLSRSINIVSTYGAAHPAVEMAASTTEIALSTLFTERSKLTIGAFNGVLTIDDVTVNAKGTLLKSLEQRLARLQITGLKISAGITTDELHQLIQLLANQEAEEFNQGIAQAGLSHIASENTSYHAVKEGETIANESDLTSMSGIDGVLVLDDDYIDNSDFSGNGSGDDSVHVEQIVAFLKGDVDLDEANLGEELTELASDPSRLGKMIMESVAIRQASTELSGESLGDIILGCLRRTYTGLRKQAAFKSSEGMADLRKSLLLLEENLLDRMRDIGGEANPELDRQIVQAVREIDETIQFESAAMDYMEHKDAIEISKKELQAFLQSKGADATEDILAESDFPESEWRKIIVNQNSTSEGSMQIATGLSSLATVFEKIEKIMKSDTNDENQVKDLLGQATENLDDSIFSTKGKLEDLSRKLEASKSGSTIGGQARHMSRDNLLTALAEVTQELMQPLTAINASLEMMLHGYVGTVTSEQKDMLSIASNSGEHLNFLMSMLIDIVGCPVNKGTDSRFHTTSDEVVLLKE